MSTEHDAVSPEVSGEESFQRAQRLSRWAVPLLLSMFVAAVGWLFQHHLIAGPANADFISTVRSVLGHPALFPVAGTARIDGPSRDRALRVHLQEVRERQGATPARVTVKRVGNANVLEADGVHLITVLQEDLPEFWTPDLPLPERVGVPAQVAERWRETLQSELEIASKMHSPRYFGLACAFTAGLLLLTLLAQSAIGHLGHRYLKSPVWFAKALLWTMTLTLVMCIFPDLQWAGGYMTHRLLWPMWLLVIIIVVGVLLAALSERILVAYFRALSHAAGSSGGERQELRLETAAHAANTVVELLLFFVGALVYLSLLGVNFAAILTSLGALGVAVGLLAQEFVKNGAAGISVLIDDRYGMGDQIQADGISGRLRVEAFTIFTTRVRDTEGAVICIPNSHLITVKNLSKLWSQVDFRVVVAYSTDLNAALEILLDEATTLASERADLAVAAPELLGVEEVGESGITLRLQVRTAPGANPILHRELNRRVKTRFDRERIEMPFPQLSVTLRKDEEAPIA